MPDAQGGRAVRGMLRRAGSDIRHAWRGLVRAPWSAGAAICTLALALGLGAAAFALIDSILIRPLAYRDADRLVLVTATVPPEDRSTVELTLPDTADLAASLVLVSATTAACMVPAARASRINPIEALRSE